MTKKEIQNQIVKSLSAATVKDYEKVGKAALSYLNMVKDELDKEDRFEYEWCKERIERWMEEYYNLKLAIERVERQVELVNEVC